MKNLYTKFRNLPSQNQLLILIVISIAIMIILPNAFAYAFAVFSSYKLINKKILKYTLVTLFSFITFASLVLALAGDSVDVPKVEDLTSEVQESISDELVDTDVVEGGTEIEENSSDSEGEQVSNTDTKKADSAKYSYYTVTSVVDGDTIKINKDGKTETLRLIGLDTPETVDPRKPVQCFGKEASDKAKELLSNKKVRIELDSTQDTRDKYGRLLVYVYREDGLFYNKNMIERGYAHEYTYDKAYKYQAEFKTAQKNAQNSQLGLWSPNTCNGDTTSVKTEAKTQTSDTAITESSKGSYYTSSHHTAKYYYPEACDGWRSLSPTYLKNYSTLEALLGVYPSKTQSPQCD